MGPCDENRPQGLILVEKKPYHLTISLDSCNYGNTVRNRCFLLLLIGSV